MATPLEVMEALVAEVAQDHQILTQIEIMLEEMELLDRELAEALETSLLVHLVEEEAVVAEEEDLPLETLALGVAEEMAALV